MNEVRDYYETYWSVNGFCPRGRIWPELSDVYQQHIPANSKILDVGCGDGHTSGVWLRDHGHDYIGVDISENAVRDARSIDINAHRIEDVASLPFSDETFDAVVCIEVLEHLFAPQRALKEILRVLKPGRGVLIATVPNVAFWRLRLDFFLLGRWNPIGDDHSAEEPWHDPHIRFFTVGTFKRLMMKTGFVSAKIGGHGGGFIMFIPGLRRLAGKNCSWLYRQIEKCAPSIFAYRLGAICYK